MDITRESVNDWLERTRRTRDWLADQCEVGVRAVGNWLNKKGEARPIPAEHQITIRRLMDEDAGRDAPAPLQNLVLEFGDAEFAAMESAALAHRSTLRDWAKSVLNGAATLDVEAFVAEYFPAALGRLTPAGPPPAPGNLLPFPEIPLLRAAAGSPILADAEMIESDRDPGPGRFLLELRGDSMEPRFHDRQRVILREKSTLKRPVLKYGELYCFIHEGAATFKQWAKDREGQKVLRSLNPDHPDILPTDDTEWIAWFDPEDNG